MFTGLPVYEKYKYFIVDIKMEVVNFAHLHKGTMYIIC